MIQTTMIIGLFYERRRRRDAESTSRSAMGKLAHMNRIATAGELTASIAHEVNQPLAAMVTNANAALRWLNNKTPDLSEVSAALNGVVSAGHRASNSTHRAASSRRYWAAQRARPGSAPWVPAITMST